MEYKLGDENLLLKIQVLHSYLNRSYTSKSGENIRLVVGQFKQQGFRGSWKYQGVLFIVSDKNHEKQHVEVFRGENVIRQIRLRKSELRILARSKANSEDFLEGLTSIVENALPIENSIEDEDTPKRQESFDDAREKY